MGAPAAGAAALPGEQPLPGRRRESGLGQEPLEDLFLWTGPERAIDLFARDTGPQKTAASSPTRFHARFKERPMSQYLAPLLEEL